MINRLNNNLLLLALILSLSGCSYISAGLTTGRLVYHRYELKNDLQDQEIKIHAQQAITLHEKEFKHSNMTATSFNHEILLIGQVPSKLAKKRAEQLMINIPNIYQVYNELEVRPPTTFLRQTKDSVLTARVKGRLIVNNNIDPSKLKVVTENNTVYLMGIVFPSQAKLAMHIAETSQGVEKVVTLFHYLKIVDQA